MEDTVFTYYHGVCSECDSITLVSDPNEIPNTECCMCHKETLVDSDEVTYIRSKDVVAKCLNCNIYLDRDHMILEDDEYVCSFCISSLYVDTEDDDFRVDGLDLV